MKKLLAFVLSLTLMCTMALPAFAQGAAKDEIVYILAAPDGTPEKIIVSDWLSNPEGAKELADMTTLTGIENVKGNETFDGAVWRADGKDIYYQGVSDAPLPVSLTISCTLDGEAITPDALTGKSGHVTLRFDYAVSKTVGDVRVPYVFLTGTMLDNNVFTHVSAENAVLVNDGDRTFVAGIALPGLMESLQLNVEDVSLPESITIEADVTAFAMPMTLTLVSSEPFALSDAEKLNNVEDLKASVANLVSGMTQLLDGSTQLIDGLSSLSSGASALNDGVTALSDGLTTLIANNATLTDGSAQVFETLLTTANTQLAAAGLNAPALTIDTYADTLNALIAAMNEEAIALQARAQVEQTVRAQSEQVLAAVTQAVEAEVTAQVNTAVEANVRTQVLAAMDMTDESYAAAMAGGLITEAQQAQIEAAVTQQMSADDVQTLIAANVTAQMASDDVQTLIAQQTEAQIIALIDQTMASDEVQQQIAAQHQSAQESLSALKAQLDSYAAFHTGLTAYTEGVASAANGAAQLKSSMPALLDGVTALQTGASALKDGLTAFNDEGVAKLDTLVNEDLDALIVRVRALIAAAKSDVTYSGIADGMDGAVRYIFRTEKQN